MNKSKFSSKVIASILSLMMVISIFPLLGNVYAATAEHPDAVTITVVDDNGQPIKDASVVIVVDSVANGDAYISETKKTDETGVVEVMASDAFLADDLTISATVTAEGYAESKLDKTAIESDDANFDVALKDVTIRDVEITGKTLTYNSKAQELVSVTEVEGDTVEYYYPSDSSTPSKNVPKETNAGEYKVRVVVKREGKNDLDEVVTAKIEKAEITGISIKAIKGLKYNEKDQKLVELSGSFDKNDIVTWTINSDVETGTAIPERTAIGTYSVKLTVDRGANYKLYEQEVTVEIAMGEIDLGNLKIEANSLTYNGEDQEALKVTDKGSDYKLFYQFAESEEKLADDKWVELTDDDKPIVKNAGTYTIYIKAVKDANYNDKKTEAYPISITVEKASSELRFEGTTATVNPRTVSGKESEFPKIFEIVAKDTALGRTEITYSVDFADDETKDSYTIDEVATINATTGELIISGKSSVKVTATLPEVDNYVADEVSYIIDIEMYPDEQGKWVGFDKDSIDYILGEKLEVNNASNLNGAKGYRNYYIETVGTHEAYGITVERGSLKTINGKTNYQISIEITDINKLAQSVEENNGLLSVKIWSVKEKSGFLGYAEDRNFYTLNIRFADVPQDAYAITETPNAEGWFNSAVTVVPAEGYKIAKGINDKFTDSVSFDDQGENNRYIYLKNNETGAITEKIAVVNDKAENLKIDTIAPDTNKMRIEIQELTIVEKMGVKFGFYNPDVNIKFIVEDELEDNESGMDYIEWFYSKDENATSSILATDSDTLPVVKDGDKYVATLTLTATEAKQFRGHISFKAYDKADNASNEVKDNGVIIVVDTINPEMSAEFTHVDATGKYNKLETSTGVYQHYFNGDVNFKFTVKEANFFPKEDVEVRVVKDGGMPTTLDLAWTSNDEIHIAEFTLSGDGDYVVSMKYKDSSGNKTVKDDQEIEVYTSEVITIDKTAPVVEIEHDPASDIQETTITVVEHNFRPEDLSLDITVKDIKGNEFTPKDLASELQKLENWEKDSENSDKYVFKTKDYLNGNYNIELTYTDIAGNSIVDAAVKQFTVDHGAPIAPVIEFVTTPVNTLLEAITFGFYKPSVTVRFTSYDDTSPVTTFTYDYIKQENVSDINADTFTYVEIDATQSADDATKFIAEIVLPAEEGVQMRGHLKAKATDTFGNDSETVDDEENIFVVDTIAPELEITYSLAANAKDSNEHFYNGDIDVTITATEANFYKDDVKVTVTKNGEIFDFGEPLWDEVEIKNIEDADDDEEADKDVHIGTFTLPAPADHSGDGHYVVNVEYTDKSGNFDEEKSAYTSHTLTIDTTAPVINVEYQNTEVKNTLKDREDKDRDYFDKTQTAVVTIEEHNFASEEVEFSIVAKDVTGAELDAEALHNKSVWTVDSTGDIHTITITYPGDANYTFDVAYTDKATNAAEDYAEDYFTVDKTAPDLGVVVYDPEFKEVVLNAITFGFYKEKVTVTLTATDPISEVHSFLYSYLNAEGVSSVNDELNEQVIEAADIKYSEDGAVATATFEIPKEALDKDNQFNGTVEFTATNRAGKESVTHKETNRVVVDNIVPTAKVTYSEAINTEGKISYYDGDIDVTIKVTEANFYSKDVKVRLLKDGKTTDISKKVKWKDKNVDEHIGTFTITEDGDYNVLIEYTDKSGNVMKSYKSNQLTIDTDIKAPTLSINGVGHTGDSGAYNKDVTISYSFEDVNYDTSNIRLTRTKFDTVEDVTSEFVDTNITADGGSGSFQIPSKVANDGIYTLTVNMADKANHTTESHMTFTVNRYGSVYVYDNYLASLIKDGGQFITINGDNKVAITEDLIINEYNACELKKDSLKILITRDGEVVNADYTWKQVNGNSGWYQYAYTINAENFKEDGVYKISLSSKYNTVDSEDNESTSVPENSFKTNGKEILDTMSFVVDTKAPEIRNVINLDKKVADKDAIKDGKLTVKYTVIDIGGLKSIEIILNGDSLETITDFGDDQFNYSGEFVINEDSKEQTVQIIVTDKAGNVTDTSAKDFSTGEVYVFNGSVTVSSSVFDRIIANVRIFFESWYANKPLFWGSIAGVVVVAGGIWFIVLAKKKKKKEDA